jgi:hypothetical protein
MRPRTPALEDVGGLEGEPELRVSITSRSEIFITVS